MIHSLQNSISTILYISLAFGLSVPSNVITGWSKLQDGAIKIETIQHDGFPFCKASKVIPFSTSKIAKILENKTNYPAVFKRITSSQELGNDAVYIKLDMPFPISNRDYIVQYTQTNKHNGLYYEFKALERHLIPIDDDYVRLINAAGGWLLEPLGIDSTKLTYYWNGELRGDFPDWALTKAWIEQGNEVMVWIVEALEIK